MKKPLIILGGIGGLALITWLLVLVAQGESYELSVEDPIIGNASAPIVIEEFSDFQCPACANIAPIVKEVLAQYPTQVQLVYKDFPLSSIHPQAREAASGALCAAQQDKFVEFHDALFEGQQTWSAQDGDVTDFMDGLVNELGLDREDWEACASSRDAKKAVDRNFSEGRERGVNSTPTFIVNGNQIQAPQSVFQWIQLINSELEELGITPENGVEEAPETTEVSAE